MAAEGTVAAVVTPAASASAAALAIASSSAALMSRIFALSALGFPPPTEALLPVISVLLLAVQPVLMALALALSAMSPAQNNHTLSSSPAYFHAQA